MKKRLLISFISIFGFAINSIAQDIINPYLLYNQGGAQNLLYPEDFSGGNPSANYGFTRPMVFADVASYRSAQTQSYKGEYEICVRRLFWWQLLGFSTIAPSSNFCFSYQYELVSFPFTINCAFNDPYYTQINLDCIPNSQTLRELYLPDPSVSLLVDNSNDSYWDYTINNYN